jgi:hypothetical protein
MNTLAGNGKLVEVDKLSLWEILVPTRVKNKGVPIEFHYAWDEQVKAITGGLTVYRAAVGQWVSPGGKTVKERMIPVRIACSEDDINKIADITAKHYKQDAVMFYLVSEKAFIKHYG